MGSVTLIHCHSMVAVPALKRNGYSEQHHGLLEIFGDVNVAAKVHERIDCLLVNCIESS